MENNEQRNWLYEFGTHSEWMTDAEAEDHRNRAGNNQGTLTKVTKSEKPQILKDFEAKDAKVKADKVDKNEKIETT